MSGDKQKRPSFAVKALRFGAGLLFGVLIPLALLGAGAWGAYRLMKTAPQAERKSGGKGEANARLVDAKQFYEEDQQIVVDTMGLVTPARMVDLQPLVSGEIISLHPNLEQGGYIAKGEVVAEIDPVDYELALSRAEAEVARMESALQLELGQQEVAREEFELLGQEIPESQTSLVLRQPQLEAARAELDRAKAALRDAELALQRTKVRAPFNALVQNENAEIGAIASQSTTIATLSGTDRYWVELSVPVDALRWVELPGPDGQEGSLVQIYDNAAWGPKAFLEGRVIRFTASVDEESRMATLVIGVNDPLGLEPENQNKPRMLLGSYVTGMIYGRQVPDSLALPRQYIREDNTVWIMNDEGRLEIRPVNILWRGKTSVILTSGINGGEWVVTSNLSAPVDGMRIRTDGDSPSIEFEDPESPAPPSELIIESDARQAS